jgi:hypothetical protein
LGDPGSFRVSSALSNCLRDFAAPVLLEISEAVVRIQQLFPNHLSNNPPKLHSTNMITHRSPFGVRASPIPSSDLLETSLLGRR